jgi:ankyrin repeat protein
MFAAYNGHLTCMKALLTAGATVEVRIQGDWTALMFAAGNGHLTCVEALLTAGATVEVRSQGDWTALMLAAENGHLACMKALLTAGATVDARNQDGWTALMVAAKNGHATCVEALLTAGATVEARDQAGSTALMVAAKNGHADVVATLVDNYSDISNAVDIAQRAGHTRIVEYLRRVEIAQKPKNLILAAAYIGSFFTSQGFPSVSTIPTNTQRQQLPTDLILGYIGAGLGVSDEIEEEVAVTSLGPISGAS